MTEATQKEKKQKICSMTCVTIYLIWKDHERKKPPKKERLTIKRKTARSDITFCDACGYCFDLMVCKIIDFIFEKVS